jgi:hypothetical protein
MKPHLLIGAVISAFMLVAHDASSFARPARSSGYSMNGITLSQIGDFAANWHLVTVRVRLDIGEMRFIYANPIAWRTMMTGHVKYPKGAMFGKVAYRIGTDPLFRSSDIPTGVYRMQIMKMMPGQPNTDKFGWTYAIFTNDDRRMPGDIIRQTHACAACHDTLARSRGEIFARPVIDPGIKYPNPAYLAYLSRHSPNSLHEPLRFVEANTSIIPKFVAEQLNPYSTVYILHGPLTKHIFPGTLNEMLPTLEFEAAYQHRPSALINSAMNMYAIAVPSHLTTMQCKNHSVPETIKNIINYNIVFQSSICFDINRIIRRKH